MKYAAVLNVEEVSELDILTIEIESALEAYLNRNKSTVLSEALEKVKNIRRIISQN